MRTDYKSALSGLLSTIDFIMETEKTKSHDEIIKQLEKWSDRKKELFTNMRFIDIAIKNIERHSIN